MSLLTNSDINFICCQLLCGVYLYFLNVYAVCSKSCSRNSIDYDEYLAGGIPDALLEGLGFYASCDDVEMTSAADDMSDEKPKPETITEPQSLTVKPSTSTGMILFYISLFTLLLMCHRFDRLFY